MTLVAIACHDDRVQILSDSFACTNFGRHTGTLGKVHMIPHLDAAMTVQGDQTFYAEWSYALAIASHLTTLEELVVFTTMRLQAVWERRWSGEPRAPYESTCYLAGYAPSAGRCRVWAYPSAHDFWPADISEGLFVFPAPYTEVPDTPTTTDDWIALAELVRHERSLDAHGTGRKTPTGGKVILTTIQPGASSQHTIGEFPSSGPMFHRMMLGLNHPSSQLAPCPCGATGELFVSCCMADHAVEDCDCGSGKRFADCCRVDPNIGPGEPCPCDSGATVADCCAPHLRQSVA